jgi:hypothetical protein
LNALAIDRQSVAAVGGDPTVRAPRRRGQFDLAAEEHKCIRQCARRWKPDPLGRRKIDRCVRGFVSHFLSATSGPMALRIASVWLRISLRQRS